GCLVVRAGFALRRDLHDARRAVRELRPRMAMRLEMRVSRHGPRAHAHRPLARRAEGVGVADGSGLELPGSHLADFRSFLSFCRNPETALAPYDPGMSSTTAHAGLPPVSLRQDAGVIGF